MPVARHALLVEVNIARHDGVAGCESNFISGAECCPGTTIADNVAGIAKRGDIACHRLKRWHRSNAKSVGAIFHRDPGDWQVACVSLPEHIGQVTGGIDRAGGTHRLVYGQARNRPEIPDVAGNVGCAGHGRSVKRDNTSEQVGHIAAACATVLGLILVAGFPHGQSHQT
jgi:hypothetical protein